jgi:hypothetical protein
MRARGLGFTFKAKQTTWVRRYLGQQRFDGRLSVQSRVLGKIDRTHSACPDLAQYAVVGNGSIYEFGHSAF